MKRLKDIELHEPLRTSAAEHDGTPCWSAVARDLGVTRERLRRVWAIMQREPETAPVEEEPPDLQLEEASGEEPDEELRQLRSSLAEIEQVIGIMIEDRQVSQYTGAARRRDELAAKIRERRETLANDVEPSPEELIAEVERSALEMPADLADVMIEIFRGRSLL